MCENHDKKIKEETEKIDKINNDKIFAGQFLKYHLKKSFSIYFNMRYLNTLKIKNPGEIYKYSFEKYASPKTNLSFEESKFEELFEIADKLEFLAASMLEIDIAELSSIDNFKENYTFTGPYARAQSVINLKDYYFQNQPEYYIQELKICFTKIECFCRVYETLYALSDFIEDIKLFNSRLSNHPQKRTLKNFYTYNTYDTDEQMTSEIHFLIENYKTILDALKDYPLWKDKFENDVSKIIAYANIKSRLPQIYEYIDQQKIFK